RPGFVARASSVRQTPPPAAPTQRRQLPGTQVGAMTRAGLRVAVVSVLPVNASTPGSIAFCSAPYGCQWLLPCGSPWAAILLKVFLAFCTIRGGITFAGYVRAADLYASYPPTGPSLGIVRALLSTASGSPAILPLASRSCETWLDGLPTETSLSAPATKASAAAADINVTALDVRTKQKTRFRTGNFFVRVARNFAGLK